MRMVRLGAVPRLRAGAKDEYVDAAGPPRKESMAEDRCATCGGPLELGFIATTNGSGIFWSHDATAARLRPHGLEVIVPTGFMGTYSANAPGARCAHCRTILLKVK